MALDAKGLVLMKKEAGILTNELGSYEIDYGLEHVFKAYVEDESVKLFITTNEDVTDEEYNEIFDEYEVKNVTDEAFEIEEIEDEYNPVWCITLPYKEEHSEMEEDLNFIITNHKREIERIYEKIKAGKAGQ